MPWFNKKHTNKKGLEAEIESILSEMAGLHKSDEDYAKMADKRGWQRSLPRDRKPWCDRAYSQLREARCRSDKGSSVRQEGLVEAVYIRREVF